MTLTDENRADTICQATWHAMLIPWGRFSRHLKLGERLRAAVVLPRHKDAIPASDLILGFGLASLAGYEYLQDLNLGPHPLARDQAAHLPLVRGRTTLDPRPLSAAQWRRRGL